MLFDASGTFNNEIEHFGATPYNYIHGYCDPFWEEGSGGLVVISEFEPGNSSTTRQILIKYGVDGDTARTHVLLDTGYVGMRQTCAWTNGRIAACGFNDPDSVDARAILLVADTNGALEYVRQYPNTLEALGVRPMGNGGLVLSGYRLSGVNNHNWVMRLDTTGNTVWRRDLGGSNFAGDNISAMQTSDGGILATCSYMPIGSNWSDPQWNYFRKWDINGNVVWTKQYNQQLYTTGYDLEELPNGDLIACGTEEAAPAPLPNSKGLLFKLQPDGDLIWLRKYYYYASFNSAHLPYDVEPTSDGGFGLTGYARQGQTDSLPGLQMVWLLKVDSMGCLVPGCGGNGVEDIVLGLEHALRAYPNPASGTLNVEAALPPDLVVRGHLQLVLVDALGRTVREQVLGQQFTRTTLAVADLPPGLYHLHLRDEGRWLSGTAVVVE